MSYFDHVKCHHCNATLNPDGLSAGMACPSCGGQLSLTDLFGVADAFTGAEAPEATLDDLLAPQRAYADDPMREFAQEQHRAHAERQASRAQARQGGSRPQAPRGPSGPAPMSSSTGMVHRPGRDDDDDDDVGGTPSALELMRKMKKGR